MALIFGLDLGSTSIGWTVIEHDRVRSVGSILPGGMGSRIFPEARDPKGTPLNQERRQKRMIRRQLRRRRARRRALNECLAEAGLLPTFSSRPAPRGTPEPWHAIMRLDPVQLRQRGIDEALSLHEFGRALYHLAQRRHFKGRDLADEPDESADEKAAAESRDSTLAALKTSDRTLGQFLASLPAGQRRRGMHHVDRATVANEFDRLWRAQANHHSVLRDPVFRAKVEDTIFAQRPVFWRWNTLGECRFMPGEELCPRGSWLSQQRRMLEKLNNLALAGGNARPLDTEERATILNKLQGQASMSWGGVRTALKPLFKARGEAGAEKTLRFNLEEGGDKGLPGNGIEARLASIFDADWADHPHRDDIREAVPRLLWSADYGRIGKQRVVILADAERRQRRAAAVGKLVADFGVTAAQAAALAELELATGWEPFSTAALQKFVPHLQDGVRFGNLVSGPDWQNWRDETFPDRIKPTGQVLDRLPSPTLCHPEEMKRIASLRNPTVVRVQNELRKVVNNLIAAYGKPDLIRIELARDIGKSKRQREEMQAGQKRQATQRKKAAADLRAKGIEPSRADIEKWLLWQECDRFDPYSGRPISFDSLFRTGEFEVEHIWPRSKCFDDGFANKTLCLRQFNGVKANRTPFESFGADPDQWPAMKKRVWDHVRNRRMAAGKAKRFCREEALDNDFTARQLNDTGFAARQAAAFLKQLWPDAGIESPVTVQVVTGRVTAQLRRLWGLNHILSDDGDKTRADHRHHAIDALVVACVDPGVTQRLSRYWQTKDDPSSVPPPRLDPPWPTIRTDAEQAAATIVVSHRVRKKVSGPLHKQTVYGDTGETKTTKNGVYRRFVTRESVTSLSKDKLDGIRDETVKRIVRQHIERQGSNTAEASPSYPKLGQNGPEIKKVRITKDWQMHLMVPASTGYAEAGANHHVAVYRSAAGKACVDIVSRFEVARRLARREPIVRRDPGDGAAFVMSLSAGDAIEIPTGDAKGYWIVQGAWASGQIVIERADDAAHATTRQPMLSTLLKNGARKVSVDPIGRVRPAGD